MFSNDDREALKKIVEARALKRGDFTLASGKKSSYYLDTKQITLHSAGLKLVSQGLLDMLDLSAVDAVGGMSIGADPIVAGILSAAGQEGVELLGLMERLSPMSLRTAVLLRKRTRCEVDMTPDFVGFDIPNEFVVGYGLDYQGAYRNLPFVAALEPDEINSTPP